MVPWIETMSPLRMRDAAPRSRSRITASCWFACTRRWAALMTLEYFLSSIPLMATAACDVEPPRTVSSPSAEMMSGMSSGVGFLEDEEDTVHVVSFLGQACPPISPAAISTTAGGSVASAVFRLARGPPPPPPGCMERRDSS